MQDSSMMNFLDKIASATPKAQQVLLDKATEYPFTSEFNTLKDHGTYLCRRCGIALFRAHAQFHSGCGWPSFDEDYQQTVYESVDVDGQRTEITCKRCASHLGHVFDGEQFTDKNRRYCVNGLALDFVKDNHIRDSGEAIIAGGCFWGVEHFMRQKEGVVFVESGYCGGHQENPSYEDVCRGTTGHIEAVRVIYDIQKTDYTSILTLFFNIHDPEQSNGQGPDLGEQYRSAIFYYNDDQKQTAESLIKQLEAKHCHPSTKLLTMKTFWPAESYHQEYYLKHQKAPYCHRFTDRFA